MEPFRALPTCFRASFAVALLIGTSCSAVRPDPLAKAQSDIDTVAQSRREATGRDVLTGSVRFKSMSLSERERATVLTSDQVRTLDDAYASMLSGCDQVMSSRTNDAATYRNIAIGMAILGSVAGGVVPVLTTASAVGNASWIAGLGTVSGAMNGLQSTMGNVGASYEGEALTRQSFLVDWRADIGRYKTERLAGNFDASVVALSDAVTTCTVYRTAINSRTTLNPLSVPAAGTPTVPPAETPAQDGSVLGPP